MSSSLMRTVGSIAASAIIFPGIAQAAGNYKLKHSWEGEKILDHFHLFDAPDPTNGFVTYVNQSHAEDAGLLKVTDSGSLYMGVDYESVLTADGPGRESVRIESNEYYDQGLYVVDIQHMPGSICGTWPAFWTVGPNWPTDGEIDIIEGVNQHDANKIVLHTSGSCDVGGENDMLGEMTSSECGDASGTIGCVVEGQKGSSGTPFNKGGGGVYAMEWQEEYLKIWYFPRSEIPESLSTGKPDISSFGKPMAHLQGSCNFKERFTHQKMILDTTFCGDWAGGIFGDSGCPISDASDPMGSCVNYVAENPKEFKNAYWELNSIKIFQVGGNDEEAHGTQAAATTKTTEAAPETTAPAPSTQTEAAPETTATAPSTETDAATHETATSTTVNTRTETVGTEHAPETAAAPATTEAPSAPSNAEPANSQTSSKKKTKYVTRTTTLCPVESLQTANAVSNPAPPSGASIETIGNVAEPETTSAPAATHEPEAPATTEGASIETIAQPEITTAPAETHEPEAPVTDSVPTTETSVDPVAQPATSTAQTTPATHAPQQPDTSSPSVPPDSVIYTAPREQTTSSSTSWKINASSSIFVSVPSAEPTSWKTTDAVVPSGADPTATGTPTTPSSPVFTGVASRMSASASVVLGALALLLVV